MFVHQQLYIAALLCVPRDWLQTTYMGLLLDYLRHLQMNKSSLSFFFNWYYRYLRSPNVSIFRYHAKSHEINCVPQQFATILSLTYSVRKEIAWNVDSVRDISPYSVGAVSVDIGSFRVGKARKSFHEHWMKIHYYKKTNTSRVR